LLEVRVELLLLSTLLEVGIELLTTLLEIGVELLLLATLVGELNKALLATLLTSLLEVRVELLLLLLLLLLLTTLLEVGIELLATLELDIDVLVVEGGVLALLGVSLELSFDHDLACWLLLVIDGSPARESSSVFKIGDGDFSEADEIV